MPRIISIDPGVRAAGVAVWDGSPTRLVYAALSRVKEDFTLADQVIEDLCKVKVPPTFLDQIVIEIPQVYVWARSKGDPNDLIRLAFVAGSIMQALKSQSPNAKVVVYKPADWKKQIPKDVSVDRTRRALTADERKFVRIPKAKSLSHNIYDAIGIGLAHMKKIGVKRPRPTIIGTEIL